MVLTPEVAYQFNTLRARPALTGLSRTCRKLESNASPSQRAQTCLGGARTADLSDQRMIMGTCLKKASALPEERQRRHGDQEAQRHAPVQRLGVSGLEGVA